MAGKGGSTIPCQGLNEPIWNNNFFVTGLIFCANFQNIMCLVIPVYISELKNANCGESIHKFTKTLWYDFCGSTIPQLP